MDKLMRLPVVFISHGSPAVALETDDYTRALRRFGSERPRPGAIVVLSAHFQAPAPVRVTAAERPSLLYDFSGFPGRLYEISYACPGAPELAAEIASLCVDGGLPAATDPRRGLDHGAWVPLLFLSPEAAVPVIELSLPLPRSAEMLMRMGAILAPLRERGVLLVGSGGVVHNLARVAFERKDAPVERWAEEFDTWFRGRLEARDLASIASYRARAPHARLAVPTTEHFDPIFFTLGAAAPDDRLRHLYEGFQHANLSMRSFAFGP